MAVATASGDVDFGVTAISAGLINLAQNGAIKVIGGALHEEKAIDGQMIPMSKKAFDAGVTTPAKLPSPFGQQIKPDISNVTDTDLGFHCHRTNFL